MVVEHELDLEAVLLGDVELAARSGTPGLGGVLPDPVYRPAQWPADHSSALRLKSVIQIRVQFWPAASIEANSGSK